MKKWDMVPETITVTHNAKVELTIESDDVEHGLSVPGLGIDESVRKGDHVAVRFIPATPGVYPMRCNIQCGRGHDDMRGRIVVR